MSKISKSYLAAFGFLNIEVGTKGNFSTIRVPLGFDLLPKSKVKKEENEVLQELFYQFEEQLGLKIISWQTWGSLMCGMRIFINHEPKEKAEVARTCHEYKIDPDEPDIGL